MTASGLTTAEEAVANEVTVGIVGFLEAIEVEAHDGKAPVVPRGIVEGLEQVLEERRPVRQPGQRVVVREV